MCWTCDGLQGLNASSFPPSAILCVLPMVCQTSKVHNIIHANTYVAARLFGLVFDTHLSRSAILVILEAAHVARCVWLRV
mmetsp:Transcript_8289/g.19832  ORF Transcript_8289/g.19832 Transcript_8289/m.19832 type:complete len:80 (-) Transcript_8289:226-465(-)